MRTKLLTATAVLLASLTATGTAWAHCGVMHDAPADRKAGGRPRVDTIDHPTGPHDVVLRTETSRNFWGGGYTNAAAFTLYGDGRLVDGDGSARQLTEVEVQRLLNDAHRVGLLGGVEFGNALVTDQGTTTVEIHAGVERPRRSTPEETPLAASTSGAGGVNRTLDIYALELVDGDHGLLRDQRHARRALRAFLHGV